MKKMAEPLDGESVTVMRKLAAELSVYLVALIIYAAANGEAENTAVLINDEGEIEGIYSKSHPVGMNGLISREETSIRYGIQSLER